MSNTVIPQNNDERVSWSLNFEDKFPAVAASLGFNPASITSLLNDSAMMRFFDSERRFGDGAFKGEQQ